MPECGCWVVVPVRLRRAVLPTVSRILELRDCGECASAESCTILLYGTISSRCVRLFMAFPVFLDSPTSRFASRRIRLGLAYRGTLLLAATGLLGSTSTRRSRVARTAVDLPVFPVGLSRPSLSPSSLPLRRQRFGLQSSTSLSERTGYVSSCIADTSCPFAFLPPSFHLAIRGTIQRAHPRRAQGGRIAA